MNPQMERWLKASLVSSFTKSLAPNYLYVQGNDRSSTEPVDRFELRIDGPNILEQSGFFKLTFFVNLLICIQRQANAYKIDDFKSVARQAFLPNINAYEFGSVDNLGSTTDEKFIDCLIRGDDLMVVDFDDVQAPSDVQFATMESKYEILISKG